MVPVSSVARETRCLHAEHRSSVATADECHEPLKARSLYESGPRTTLVFVDGHHRRKAHLASHVRKVVLAALALSVIDNLPRRGLAHVDNRAPTEVLVSDLGVHLPSPLRLAVPLPGAARSVPLGFRAGPPAGQRA